MLKLRARQIARDAEFRGADLHTTRTIQAGEEITIDYGDDWVE